MLRQVCDWARFFDARALFVGGFHKNAFARENFLPTNYSTYVTFTVRFTLIAVKSNVLALFLRFAVAYSSRNKEYRPTC